LSTWFITGCSTGLGRALALAVLDRGDNVVATARDVAKVEDLVAAYPGSGLAMRLDVTDPVQVAGAVSAAEERFGGIDVLVNNAGYGYRAAVEEGEPEAVEALFATNFFGPVSLIQAVLPAMRARRAGSIVNISSVGVRTGQPGSGYYAAAKLALEGVTAALRKEVEPLGISAMAVEPSGFRTDFAGRSLVQSQIAIDDYAGTAGRRRKENISTHGHQRGDPAKAAQALIAVVNGEKPPFMLVLGPDALRNFRKSLDELSTDLDAFEEVSISTDLTQ
jgi:NAD(P)-dependent dehydrogenase (short-subunit alcohol dehydrogenase family)